jgi:hypothetical protein
MYYDSNNKHNRWMKVPMAILFGAVVITVVGWVTMTLWNFTVPDLFHGPSIGYWQAIALLILTKFFFGGFHGKHRHGCKHDGPSFGGGKMAKEWETKDWSRYMQRMMWMKQMQKVYWMKHLTPEEREKMKQEWKEAFSDDFKPWEDEPKNP